MEYTKTTWKSGDTITSTGLNNIETGISNAAAELKTVNAGIQNISKTVTEQSGTINTNTQNISTVEKSVQTLNKTVNSVQGTIDSVSESVTQLNSTVETLGTGLTSVSGSVSTLNGTVSELSTTVDGLYDQVTKTAASAGAAESDIIGLQSSIAELQYLIDTLRNDGAANESITSENATINKPDERVVLSTSGTNATVTTVTAKAISGSDLSVASGRMVLTATENVSLSNITTSGDLPKATANAAWSINTNGVVNINGGTVAQTGYNSIEIGLTSTSPKNVVIKDIDFSGKLSNNAILIFDTADDAVITIENCHFADVSNAIRLSNRSNVKCTLNIINCTIDKYDSRSPWQGVLLFEDYTAKTAEDCVTDNRFGPDKITVNMINCTGPKGKITMPEDLATICGTGTDDQIIYIWNNNENPAGNQALPYSAERYPTINIK